MTTKADMRVFPKPRRLYFNSWVLVHGLFEGARTINSTNDDNEYG